MDAQSAAKLPFNLKIIPTNRDGIPMGVPFLAMLNPENFSVKEDVTWYDKPLPGKNGSDPTFLAVRPRTFTIDFILDGTGVNTNGVKIPVTAQVALFRGVTTNIRGTIHRPSYLMVYTMFDLAGLPIRAKISASFTERIIPGLSDVLGMLSSPDLTHEVEVKEYDLLPLLTYNIYQNQHYYLQVAKANRIKNFRKLKPGMKLSFYPLVSAKKQ